MAIALSLYVTAVNRIPVTDFDHFVDKTYVGYDMGRGTSYNDEIWKKQMFSLKGEEWRNVRGAISPIFTPLKLKKMLPAVARVALDLESHVADLVGQDMLLDPMLLGSKFSTDTSARMVFGVDAGAFTREEESEFSKHANLTVLFTIREKFYSLAYMVPGVKQLIDLLKIPIYSPTATKYFINLVKLILKERKHSGETTNLSLLMQKALNRRETWASEPEDPREKQQYFETLVIANLLIMLVAGLETTAISLGYCVWALSLNPGLFGLSSRFLNNK